MTEDFNSHTNESSIFVSFRENLGQLLPVFSSVDETLSVFLKEYPASEAQRENLIRLLGLIQRAVDRVENALHRELEDWNYEYCSDLLQFFWGVAVPTNHFSEIIQTTQTDCTGKALISEIEEKGHQMIELCRAFDYELDQSVLGQLPPLCHSLDESIQVFLKEEGDSLTRVQEEDLEKIHQATQTAINQIERARRVKSYEWDREYCSTLLGSIIIIRGLSKLMQVGPEHPVANSQKKFFSEIEEKGSQIFNLLTAISPPPNKLHTPWLDG